MLQVDLTKRQKQVLVAHEEQLISDTSTERKTHLHNCICHRHHHYRHQCCMIDHAVSQG